MRRKQRKNTFTNINNAIVLMALCSLPLSFQRGLSHWDGIVFLQVLYIASVSRSVTHTAAVFSFSVRGYLHESK